MSGVPLVITVIGGLLAVGGWLALMAVLFKYGLHSSFHFAAGMRRLFTPEAKPDRRRALIRFAVMMAGVCVLFVGIASGDAQRNEPCVDDCRAGGYRSGRFRGSPHDVVNGRSQGPYQCWCYHSEADWAPAPLDLPSPE